MSSLFRSKPLVAFAAALLMAACTSGSLETHSGDTEGTADSPPAATEGNPGAQPTSEPILAEIDPAGHADAALPTDTSNTQDAAMTEPTPSDDSQPASEAPAREVATLGAGCFWCIEAVLEQIDGVESVVSGYMGGEDPNPTYQAVCTGTTGHAEVVQVTFDPTVLSYQELLDWFWRLHDPTTLNRQGADRGTQYRSAIFTHSEEQARIATTSKEDVQPSFDDPIVTEITPATLFHVAEGYHQGYYFDNTGAGYCRAVIAPKLKKLGLKY